MGAWQALFVILDLLLYKHCSKQSWAATTTVSLPWLGTSSVLSLVAQSVAAAVTITWVVCRHSTWAWTLQDVLGIALMLLVLQQLRLPNLKVGWVTEGKGGQGGRCSLAVVSAAAVTAA